MCNNSYKCRAKFAVGQVVQHNGCTRKWKIEQFDGRLYYLRNVENPDMELVLSKCQVCKLFNKPSRKTGGGNA